MAHAVK